MDKKVAALVLVIVAAVVAAAVYMGMADEGNHDKDDDGPSIILDAEISTNKQGAEVGEKIEFSGAKSTPQDKINDYYWDFGDGETGQGMTVTHAYDSPGTKNVVLNVSDGKGYFDEETYRITIVNSTSPETVPKAQLNCTGAQNPLTGKYTFTILVVTVTNTTGLENVTFQLFDNATEHVKVNGTLSTLPNIPGTSPITYVDLAPAEQINQGDSMNIKEDLGNGNTAVAGDVLIFYYKSTTGPIIGSTSLSAI